MWIIGLVVFIIFVLVRYANLRVKELDELDPTWYEKKEEENEEENIDDLGKYLNGPWRK
jgi:hypothetical protein